MAGSRDSRSADMKADLNSWKLPASSSGQKLLTLEGDMQRCSAHGSGLTSPAPRSSGFVRGERRRSPRCLVRPLHARRELPFGAAATYPARCVGPTALMFGVAAVAFGAANPLGTWYRRGGLPAASRVTRNASDPRGRRRRLTSESSSDRSSASCACCGSLAKIRSPTDTSSSSRSGSSRTSTRSRASRTQ
jgi:hypothetical protein